MGGGSLSFLVYFKGKEVLPYDSIRINDNHAHIWSVDRCGVVRKKEITTLKP